MAGKTLAENLESVPDLAEGQQVIMPMDKPIKETGHIQVRLCCPIFCPEAASSWLLPHSLTR